MQIERIHIKNFRAVRTPDQARIDRVVELAQ